MWLILYTKHIWYFENTIICQTIFIRTRIFWTTLRIHVIKRKGIRQSKRKPYGFKSGFWNNREYRLWDRTLYDHRNSLMWRSHSADNGSCMISDDPKTRKVKKKWITVWLWDNKQHYKRCSFAFVHVFFVVVHYLIFCKTVVCVQRFFFRKQSQYIHLLVTNTKIMNYFCKIGKWLIIHKQMFIFLLLLFVQVPEAS